MKNQLIEQIKAMPGIKEVQAIGDVAVVVFGEKQVYFNDVYGVPMMLGMCYYWVDDRSGDNTIYGPCIIDWPIEIENENPMPNTTKIFASKESAQKWINEQKKPQPIYTDPDDGTEFFEGYLCWYFNKNSNVIHSDKACIQMEFEEGDVLSKVYDSLRSCELALAQFIINKYQ